MITTTAMLAAMGMTMRLGNRTTTVIPIAIRIAQAEWNTTTPIITATHTTMPTAPITAMATPNTRILMAATIIRIAMTTATTMVTTTVTTAWVRQASRCRA
ncbi:hypothetical protein RHIZO_03728 [Rhizobiaceae bacterium]|nr:hypothetical protein RHIZO_03728 [Rhizobiaceae bacterium]